MVQAVAIDVGFRFAKIAWAQRSSEGEWQIRHSLLESTAAPASPESFKVAGARLASRMYVQWGDSHSQHSYRVGSEDDATWMSDSSRTSFPPPVIAIILAALAKTSKELAIRLDSLVVGIPIGFFRRVAEQKVNLSLPRQFNIVTPMRIQPRTIDCRPILTGQTVGTARLACLQGIPSAIIVDLGWGTTDLVTVSNGKIDPNSIVSLHKGVSDVVLQLSEKMGVKRVEAERMLRYGDQRSIDLRRWLASQIAEHVARRLRESPGNPIIVTGGAAGIFARDIADSAGAVKLLRGSIWDNVHGLLVVALERAGIRRGELPLFLIQKYGRFSEE